MMKNFTGKTVCNVDLLDSTVGIMWCDSHFQMLDLIVDVFNNKGNKDLDIPPPVSEAPPIPRLSK